MNNITRDDFQNASKCHVVGKTLPVKCWVPIKGTMRLRSVRAIATSIHNTSMVNMTLEDANSGEHFRFYGVRSVSYEEWTKRTNTRCRAASKWALNQFGIDQSFV